MNKTQKEALFSLGMSVLAGIVFVHLAGIISDMLTGGDIDETIRRSRQIFLTIWVPIFLCYLWLSFYYLKIKKTKDAAISDERDELIKRKALLVSFISVWIFLAVSYFLLWWGIGLDGSVQICVIPLIYLAIFLLTMLVYNAAVIIQYINWKVGDMRGKGNE